METFIDLYENKESITFKEANREYIIKLQGTTETPYFCGKDVCKILGYVDFKKALQVHVKPKHKLSLKQLVEGTAPSNTSEENISLGRDVTVLSYNDGKAIYISEPGLYSLIMHSRAKFAEKFQDVVYEQILPSIRKYGTYHRMQREIELKDEEIASKSRELQHAKEYALTLKDLIVPETRRVSEEIIYISTSVNYARRNRFKVGGVERVSKLKARLSQYNGRSATGDEWYYVAIFKVASFRECERRICDVMQRFRDNKLKEIYVMHYDNIYEFVRYIVDHYNAEIDLFEETISMLIANLNINSMVPVVPEPCEEMNEISIDRRLMRCNRAVQTEDVIKKQLKEYLDSLPSGTVVNRSEAIDELDIKQNKRGFWRWLKDLIPSYPSLILKY